MYVSVCAGSYSKAQVEGVKLVTRLTPFLAASDIHTFIHTFPFIHTYFHSRTGDDSVLGYL